VPSGRTVVVGAGKAAAAMAKVTEEHWRGELSGLVVTRYGHGLHCRRIEVVEAGHPLPDSAGASAAKSVLERVGDLSDRDLVIVLLSGGGSALLNLPATGLSLDDVRLTSDRLLRSGAPIAEINCVRKHLSAITGGRLAAAAWPARVVTFAISDVPGDDPAVIASGPTVADPTTFAQALEIVDRYSLDLPPAVLTHLETGPDETPKPGDPRLERSRFVLLATPTSALEAAAAIARTAGVETVSLGAEIQGESRLVAAEHAALMHHLLAAREGVHGGDRAGGDAAGEGSGTQGIASTDVAARDTARESAIGEEPTAAGTPRRSRPLLILSGGETTVIVKGTGRGGRNTEYLLSLALALEAGGTRETGGRDAETSGAPKADSVELPVRTANADHRPPIYALAADTDGVDGTEDNAGALLYPDTLARARAAGIDPAESLSTNDSYGFFMRLDDLLVTGPTRTNVNDFRAILAI
jgi:glycerate 2-kinase